MGRHVQSHSSKLGMMQQQRFLNLHEYQSMEVFDKFGVAVPKFKGRYFDTFSFFQKDIAVYKKQLTLFVVSAAEKSWTE